MDEYDGGFGVEIPGESSSVRRCSESSLFGLRKIFAAILLTLGLLLACWTTYMVYTVLHDPDDIPLSKVVSSEILKLGGNIDGKSVKLDLPGRFFGVFSVFLILLISTTLSGTLITQGVNLLNLDMLKLLRKFNDLKEGVLNNYRK